MPITKRNIPYLMEAAAAAGLLLAGWAWSSGCVAKAWFVGEVIRLTIDPEVISMEGIYHYANPWPFPVTQGLAVPFPAGAGSGRPEAVRVELESPDGPTVLVPLWWLGGRPHFQLSLGPGQTRTVRIHYAQPYRPPEARYLLTTTQPWRRPLDRGLYLLHLRSMELEHSNYQLRPTGPGAYFFERTKFMPVEDWILRLRPPEREKI